jgi:hypothetical protein
VNEVLPKSELKRRLANAKVSSDCQTHHVLVLVEIDVGYRGDLAQADFVLAHCLLKLPSCKKVIAAFFYKLDWFFFCTSALSSTHGVLLLDELYHFYCLLWTVKQIDKFWIFFFFM